MTSILFTRATGGAHGLLDGFTTLALSKAVSSPTALTVLSQVRSCANIWDTPPLVSVNSLCTNKNKCCGSWTKMNLYQSCSGGIFRTIILYSGIFGCYLFRLSHVKLLVYMFTASIWLFSQVPSYTIIVLQLKLPLRLFCRGDSTVGSKTNACPWLLALSVPQSK